MMAILQKKTKLILLAVLGFLFISTLFISIYCISNGNSDGQVGENMIGVGFFKAYTNLSNIFLGIVSLIVLVQLLTKKNISKLVLTIYLSAVICVSLTFLVVLFFLTPVFCIRDHSFDMFIMLYSKEMFFFHFFNPLLAFLSLFLIKTDVKFGWKENIFCLIPTVIYSLVYSYNVLICKNWSDFYNFTFGGKYYLVPIVIIVIFSITYLLGHLYIKLLYSRQKLTD